MAKLTLDVESNALPVFQQTIAKMEELRSGIDTFGKTGKASFKNVTDETQRLTTAVEDGSKQTGNLLNNTTALGKSTQTIRVLRQEMNLYIANAQAAGKGTDEWRKNLEKATEVKEKIVQLQAVLGGIATNEIANVAKGFATVGQVGTQAYEGIVAAQVIFGEKNKEVEETLLKLQALDRLAAVIQEFSLLSEKVTQLKVELAPVGDLFISGAESAIGAYSSANESLVGFFSNFKENAKAAFSAAVTFVKDFGSNAVSIAKNIGTGFISFFSNFGTNMKTFAKAAKDGINTIGAAIKDNPLGLILVIVGAIIGAMIALKDKVKPIADLFEFLGEVIGAVGDAIEAVGQAIGIVATASEKEVQATIDGAQKKLDAINSYYDQYVKIVEAAGGKAIQLQQDQQQKIIDATVETITAIKVKNADAYESYQNSLDAALKLREQRQAEGNTNALKVIDKYIADLKVKGVKISDDDKKALDEALKNQREAITERVSTLAKSQKDEAANAAKLLKEAEDRRKTAADKQKQLANDLAQALLDIAKRAAQADIDGLNGEEKLKAAKKEADREVDVLKENLIKKQEAAGKGNQLSSAVQSEFHKLYLHNETVFADGIIAIEIDKATRISQQQKKEVENTIEFFNQQEKIRIAAVQQTLKPKGMTEEEFESIKQKNILIIQKQGVEERFELQKQEIAAKENADVIAAQNELLAFFKKNDDVSNLRKQQLTQDIENIKANAELETRVLTEEEKAKIVALSKEIKDETGKIKAQSGTIDWASILGVSKEQAAQIKQGIAEIVSKTEDLADSAFQYEQSQLDNEAQIYAQRQSQRESDISDLKDQLSKEQDLKNQGLANNVSLINKEIAAQEQGRQKDIAAQKKIQDQKKTLAKEQLIVDTALQASQLVTAIATTISTYAAAPYVAAALVALEVGTFIAAKAEAFSAINKSDSNSFKDGVIDIQGPGSGTSDSIPSNLSKGESVMTAEETRRHKSLFLGIRNNDAKLLEIGIEDLLKNTGVSLPKNAPSELSKIKSEAHGYELNIMMPKKDKDHTYRLESIEKNIDKLVKQGEKRTMIDPVTGDMIIEQGKTTRIIRRK